MVDKHDPEAASGFIAVRLLSSSLQLFSKLRYSYESFQPRNCSRVQRNGIDARLITLMFLLVEDGMNDSAAGLSRGNDFVKYILENKIPGVHFHHSDEKAEGFSEATMNTAAGRPRLVDGAHEDHMIPGYDQLNSEPPWDSHSVVFKILEDQGSKGHQSMGGHSGELSDPRGHVFHLQSLEFLEESGGHFLTKNLKGVERNCSMLLHIADNLNILPPPNRALPWDVLNMARWRDSLCELIKEMKTVKEKCCPSLFRNPGVYVLTTSPYGAFLRTLATEIADAAEKTRF